MPNDQNNSNAARVQRMETAIVNAAAVFRTYERMWLSRGSTEGKEKAAVNAAHAAALEAALQN